MPETPDALERELLDGIEILHLLLVSTANELLAAVDKDSADVALLGQPIHQLLKHQPNHQQWMPRALDALGTWVPQLAK